jgi:hypothetical protein
MPDAYPLAWPPGWPRTTRRKPSRYTFGATERWRARGASLAPARDYLLDELRLLKARSIVISTNVELRRDGLPYANRSEPEDPGVAVYFALDGERRCIPADKWDRVGCNLYAVARTINALRQLDRDGTHRMVTAAFAGFKALPERASGTPWWGVLGVDADERDLEVLGRAYRDRAILLHPDRNAGAEEAFVALGAAYQQAKDAAKGGGGAPA